MPTDIRRGVALKPAQFEFELRRRGIQGKQLAARAGLSEPLVSRARRGIPIAPESFAKLAKALHSFKPLPGVGELIGAENESAAGPDHSGGAAAPTSRNEKPVTAAKTVTGKEGRTSALNSES